MTNPVIVNAKHTRLRLRGVQPYLDANCLLITYILATEALTILDYSSAQFRLSRVSHFIYINYTVKEWED